MLYGALSQHPAMECGACIYGASVRSTMNEVILSLYLFTVFDIGDTRGGRAGLSAAAVTESVFSDAMVRSRDGSRVWGAVLSAPDGVL